MPAPAHRSSVYSFALAAALMLGCAQVALAQTDIGNSDIGNHDIGNPMSMALKKAVIDHDWGKALSLAKAVSPYDLKAAALPAAKDGEPAAMWLVGAAQHSLGNLQDSADWFYKGMLGTRLDLAICRDDRASGITWIMIQTFHSAVWSVRTDRTLRTHAIKKALTAHGGPGLDPHPGWSCRWAVKERFIPDSNMLMAPESRWGWLRLQALKNFQTQAGLGKDRGAVGPGYDKQ